MGSTSRGRDAVHCRFSDKSLPSNRDTGRLPLRLHSRTRRIVLVLKSAIA